MTSFTLPHILGVAFGLGIATGMDLFLAKNILTKRTFRESQYKILLQLSSIVAFGLLLLWFSGLGFLWSYQQTSPEKLLNPKIWSKVMIVTILTINGVLIHFYMLPKLKKCIGKRVDLECGYKELTIMFTSGAISMVSWYLPFIYGTVPQLNFAYSFTAFTLAYLTILTVAIVGALTVLGLIYEFDSVGDRKSTRLSYVEDPQLKSEFSDAFSNMMTKLQADRSYREQPLKLLSAAGNNGPAAV